MTDMSRFAPLLVARLLFACTGSATARPAGTLDGYGLRVTLARGCGVRRVGRHPSRRPGAAFEARVLRFGQSTDYLSTKEFLNGAERAERRNVAGGAGEGGAEPFTCG